MYSRQEASRLKQEFWTRFGQYMKPILSAGGEKVNWSNYKTGVPNIYFRMRAENNYASIGIEFTHPSDVLRDDMFEQFESFKNYFHETMGEEWTWQRSFIDEYGKQVSRIFTELPSISVFREEDWGKIISFLKPRIILLDQVWEEVKSIFEV